MFGRVKKLPQNRENKAVWRIAAVASFLLPVTVVIIIFMIRGIYPFGNKSFLVYDMYHQYFPFFAEFFRKVKAGESLYFSYNVGIGSNFLALFVYYLASPFNWLGLMVSEEHLIEFLSYLAVFRFGLCGFTCFYYLSCHFESEKRRPAALLFSCFYAFSGFMAAYNYNVMWIDCVVILPVILLGLERLVKEGKCGMYCLALSFSILTNYYISIMICIFLVMYFITLLVTEKRSLKIIFRFAFYSLLAGGLAAALLVPEVCAILETDFSDMNFPGKLEKYFSILDILARHCVGVYAERGLNHWPNIYCGTPVFFLIPMYLTNDTIPMKRKFCNMALAGIFLFSFATNMTDFVWHGMNYPDSLPARQSFLYIFVVIVMCYEAYLHMDRVSEKYILYGYLAGIVFLLFCEKFADTDHYETDIVFVSVLFLTIFAVLFYLLRMRSKRLTRQIIGYFLMIALVAEIFVNSFVTSLGTVSRTAYVEDWEDYKALYQYTKEIEDQDIYRLEKFTRKTKNDGTMLGYPTASVFSSTLNSQVMDLYKKLGMQNSKVFYGYEGATPLVTALLNVDWMFGRDKDFANNLFSEEEKSGNITLYRVNYRLPFGYTAPVDWELPENVSSIRLQNSLVRRLDINESLFVFAPAKSDGDDIVVTAAKDGIYYAVLTSAGTSRVKVMGGSLEEMEYKDLKKDGIIYLGYLCSGDAVTITNADEKDTTPKIYADAYMLNEAVLKKVLDKLSDDHLENLEADSTRISGDISLAEDKKMILSVPYEKGWSVYVDGEKTEAETFGGVLTAIPLSAGSHRILLSYVPYGFYAGILTSAASLFIFSAAMILAHRNRKKTCLRQDVEEVLNGIAEEIEELSEEIQEAEE